MNYFFLYQTLKARFSSGAATHSPGESAFGFLTQEFHSRFKNLYQNSELPFDISLPDSELNKDFIYPIFHPNKEQQSDGCIILLHGLNERSWDKYLAWGYQLANYTRKTVILFPIAHHMNRSPKAWSDPRQMSSFVKHRRSILPEVNQLSVANVALSERLTNRPERFLLSGYQAANDILDLVDHIRAGHHPMIKKEAKIDFFAYSIGSFLAQILFLANGDKELANSKLLIFCGGSTFTDWQGVSKYIMDSKAFERLHNYYESENKFDPTVLHVMNETSLGRSFVDMLSLKNLKKRSGKCFLSMKDRVSTVVLKNDNVAIADKVKNTLKGMRVEEWDFKYPYSHIMPFPLLSNKLVNQVNKAFDRLMLKAALLFTT
ncbi:MAG: DUF6051 family protein [Carboxylicivirga sp.]|nr:DUF6051 family protein [Carboxylicivirga sp.]